MEAFVSNRADLRKSPGLRVEMAMVFYGQGMEAPPSILHVKHQGHRQHDLLSMDSDLSKGGPLAQKHSHSGR